jgi:dynactin complex subunit
MPSIEFKKSIGSNGSSVHIGDRVLVKGKYSGIVRYIGDLDSNLINSKTFVGVKLDDPVGIHDGIHKGKRFFKCPPSHGVFVPINQVDIISIPGKRKASSSNSATTELCQERKGFTRTLTDYITKHTKSPSNDLISTVPMVGSFNYHSPQNTSISHEGKYDSYSKLPTLKLSTSSLLNRCSSSLVNESKVYDGAPVTNSTNNAIKKDKSVTSSALKLQNSQKSKHNENELDITQWHNYVRSIKSSPTSAKIYLKSKSPGYQPPAIELDKSNENEEEPNKIESNISYTDRLLSGLPKGEDIAPPTDVRLKDLEEFGFWLKEWGGDMRGWTMANTFQRLKDAKRKGENEIQWQKKIDELHSDEEFGPCVERIRDLHQEIAEIRRVRYEYELCLRNKTFSGTKSTAIRQSLQYYKEMTEEEAKKSSDLEAAIQACKSAKANSYYS